MAKKRPSKDPSGRHQKKRRPDDPVLTVLDAFTDPGALPTDTRKLLEVAWPIVLKPNNTHRQPHHNDIVDRAEMALISLQEEFEQKHAEALKAQNEVTAPAEHQRRTKAKKIAEESLEAATAKLEASRGVQSAARKAFHDAQIAWKSAQKDVAGFEREMQAPAYENKVLSGLLVNECNTLLNGTASEGESAARQLVKCGKKCKLDDTLLMGLSLNRWNEPSTSTRSEFVSMMCTHVRGEIEKKIRANSDTLSALAASRTKKLAVVNTAMINMENKKAAATEASGYASETQVAHKDAEKHFFQTENKFHQIWSDMKKACDAQDVVAKLKKSTEQLLKQLQQQKRKAGVEEPVKEEAGVEAEAEAPREAEAAMVDEKAEEPTEEEEAAVEAEAVVEPAVSQEPAEEVEEPAEDLAEEEAAEAEAAAASMGAKPAVVEEPAEEVVELAEEPTEEEEAEAEADAAPPMETEPAVSEEPAEEVEEPAEDLAEEEAAEAEADAAASMEAKPAVAEEPAEEVVEPAEEPTEEEEAEAEADAAPPMETEPAVSEDPAEEVVEPVKEPTEEEEAEAEADAATTM
jgi:fused signal recognition particle receptor